METNLEGGLSRIHANFAEYFGLSRAIALSAIALLSLVTIFAVFWFFHSAPPNTITITSGPEGSIFRANAEKYSKILARNGVKLKILQSEGSQENLKRLADPSFRVDIGFVQGGVVGELNIDKLVSLGSISYEPLLIFYRSAEPFQLLSQMNGKRLAIGPKGSGTQTLALALLKANGLEAGGATALVDMHAEDATKALIEGKVDAVFLMGDSASIQIIRTLLRTEGIQLFDFTQADGYTRRIDYLSKLILPRGSIDFGKNIPAQDVHLISPTVELIARDNLHPAVSDLLLETATEVHGRAGLFKNLGEFPTPLEHEFRISADASRFYKSGKTFLYRYLPFWMASLVTRILVVFVPMFLVLIPGLRSIPAVYRWRMRMRIYRWYRLLLAVEQEMSVQLAPEKQEELRGRLDHIERQVNKMKVPASFAESFYVLRGHIGFVRSRLMDSIKSHWG
jgi:NMT1-like family